MSQETIKLSRKDFVSDQAVRWCPGCGDYAILAQIQKVLPDLGLPKEKFVFVSGIGCSSRFPYYMNTYGVHSIHGRAPTLAAGLKIANPSLSVWVITGDGDGLSIGGNHLVHTIRRNIDLNIILFNNRIYGLTKGQFSPTSRQGQRTRSSPMGTIEKDFNPLSVALGAEATFVARTVDTNVRHLAQVLKRAAAHKGTSFVEVYQNCVIFNDGTHDYISNRKIRSENMIDLEHGKPLIFGKKKDKGIRFRNMKPEVVSLDSVPKEELLVHDETAPTSYAFMLSRMRYPQLPEPIGVLRAISHMVYEEGLLSQIDEATEKQGQGELKKLFYRADTWEVSEEQTNGHTPTFSDKTPGPSEFDDEYSGTVFHGEGTSDTADISLVNDKLSDLKPYEPLTAHVDISLAEAIRKMKELDVGFMALVNDEGKLVGVFTEGDVFTKIACKVRNLEDEKVKDYMTSKVTSLTSDAPIAHALQLMSVHNFRHIPIIDEEGKPTGVVSFRSVVHYIEENSPAVASE